MQCATCNRVVDINASVCPNCGRPDPWSSSLSSISSKDENEVPMVLFWLACLILSITSVHYWWGDTWGWIGSIILGVILMGPICVYWVLWVIVAILSVFGVV